MTLKEAIEAATPTTQGDRFAISEPFSDVTFVAAYWEHDKAIRVRGHRFDEQHRTIVDAWDVGDIDGMTIPFRPMAR